MAEPNPASRVCAIRTIKRTVRVPGSRRVENTRRERTLSIPYNERTGSVPREYLTHRDRTSTVPRRYLDRTSTVPRPYLDRTSTVPRPYLDRTSTVPQPYLDRTPRPHLDRTSTVPRPYHDRTSTAPEEYQWFGSLTFQRVILYIYDEDFSQLYDKCVDRSARQ